MQWTMWSKSWTSKDKGSSYHHSQSPAGSQISGDSDPLPGLLECSNHSQEFEWSGTWELSNPNKLSNPLPTHSVAKSLQHLHPQVPGGLGASREVTQEPSPSARDPQSPPAQSAGDTPSKAWRALQNSFQMSHCLCCGFPIWEMGMMLICPCGVCGIRGGSLMSGNNTISNPKTRLQLPKLQSLGHSLSTSPPHSRFHSLERQNQLRGQLREEAPSPLCLPTLTSSPVPCMISTGME